MGLRCENQGDLAVFPKTRLARGDTAIGSGDNSRHLVP